MQLHYAGVWEFQRSHAGISKDETAQYQQHSTAPLEKWTRPINSLNQDCCFSLHTVEMLRAGGGAVREKEKNTCTCFRPRSTLKTPNKKSIIFPSFHLQYTRIGFGISPVGNNTTNNKDYDSDDDYGDDDYENDDDVSVVMMMLLWMMMTTMMMYEIN